MKMEVRVFTAGPIMVDEITAWFKDQEPRIPVTVSVVEREGESRTAVYALFLDAPVVENVAAGASVSDSEALAWEIARSETRRKENEELLDMLVKWFDGGETPQLFAQTAELLKKAGRA